MLAERYQKRLDEWRRLNREQWEFLAPYGVTDGTELQLEYTFSAPDEPSARALAAAYEQQFGAAPNVILLPDEGPNDPEIWTVSGITPPTPSTLQSIEVWVEELIRLGAEFDCLFEGWGAIDPSTVPATFDLGNLPFLEGEDSTVRERFPVLLHVRVPLPVQPEERQQVFEGPLRELLQHRDAGCIVKSGSVCEVNGNDVQIVGFDIIIRVSDPDAISPRIRSLLAQLGAPVDMTINVLEMP